MRLIGKELYVFNEKTLRGGVPAPAAGDLVDQKWFMIGIVQLEITRAQTKAAVHCREAFVGRQLEIELGRNRHCGLERRLSPGRQHQIVEIEIVGLNAERT